MIPLRTHKNALIPKLVGVKITATARAVNSAVKHQRHCRLGQIVRASTHDIRQKVGHIRNIRKRMSFATLDSLPKAAVHQLNNHRVKLIK